MYTRAVNVLNVCKNIFDITMYMDQFIDTRIFYAQEN